MATAHYRLHRVQVIAGFKCELTYDLYLDDWDSVTIHIMLQDSARQMQPWTTEIPIPNGHYDYHFELPDYCNRRWCRLSFRLACVERGRTTWLSLDPINVINYCIDLSDQQPLLMPTSWQIYDGGTFYRLAVDTFNPCNLIAYRCQLPASPRSMRGGTDITSRSCEFYIYAPSVASESMDGGRNLPTHSIDLYPSDYPSIEYALVIGGNVDGWPSPSLFGPFTYQSIHYSYLAGG